MFGRERSNNCFLKLEEENPKPPIPPDQTQTDKIIQCSTSRSISEIELMDMRRNNYVELALELTMPSSNMKIPWCLKIYLKGYSGYEETEGDSHLEFTLKVATALCSLDNLKAAVVKETTWRWRWCIDRLGSEIYLFCTICLNLQTHLWTTLGMYKISVRNFFKLKYCFSFV